MEDKLLIFSLANEKYAANIMQVERILNYVKPIKVPECPDFIEGVINYEDDALPILNIGTRLNIELEADIDHQKVIVIKSHLGKLGVIVDDVLEVLSLKNGMGIEIPKTMSSFIARDYMRGFIKTEKGLIILLDFNKVLTKEEEALIF